MKSCQKLKGVHKLKCEYGHDDKKVTLAENNISIKTVFLNTQTFKMIQQNTNVYVVRKVIKKSLMKS